MRQSRAWCGESAYPMDLERMLDRCQKGQWDADDFDYTGQPIALSKFDEIEVCQALTNLIYVERIAGLTFLELSKKVSNPTLKLIYESFHADEVRHSVAVAKLADYFNVHDYRIYTPDERLTMLVRYITRTIQEINPAFASAMVTLGELVLDVALLRAVNDYIEDPLSRAVIEKINQDESRHIAMDFYLMEEFGRQETAPPSAADLARLLSNLNLFGSLTWAVLFFGNFFVRVVAVMDPEGSRFLEAQKRFEMLGQKNPDIAKNRGYNILLSVSKVLRELFPRYNAVTNVLKVGVKGEIARAESVGEKHSAKSSHAPAPIAADLAVELS